MDKRLDKKNEGRLGIIYEAIADKIVESEKIPLKDAHNQSLLKDKRR